MSAMFSAAPGAIIEKAMVPSLVCMGLSFLLASCATTGPYDDSRTGDRFSRYKCEEIAQSAEYQNLPSPKAAFVARDSDGHLECEFVHGGANTGKEERLSAIRSKFPTATLVAFNDELLTHTELKKSDEGPSWAQIILGGVAQIAGAAAAANQQNDIQQASSNIQQQQAMIMAQEMRRRQIEEANRQTEMDRNRWEQARLQATQLQIQKQQQAQIAQQQQMRIAAAVSAPKALAPPARPKRGYVLHSGDVEVEGGYSTNWHNDRAYTVRVLNRATFPIDCDVELTASFWNDSLGALNPLSGPGLATIQTKHGSVSNLQPGSRGTALEVTHLVQNSRITYAAKNCRVAQMYLLSGG